MKRNVRFLPNLHALSAQSVVLYKAQLFIYFPESFHAWVINCTKFQRKFAQIQKSSLNALMDDTAIFSVNIQS